MGVVLSCVCGFFSFFFFVGGKINAKYERGGYKRI